MALRRQGIRFLHHATVTLHLCGRVSTAHPSQSLTGGKARDEAEDIYIPEEFTDNDGSLGHIFLGMFGRCPAAN
jgi:hypothetical protein